MKYQSQEKLADDFLVFQLDRPGFYSEIEGFVDYFLVGLRVAQINLARVGVGVAKRKLIGAETPWGQARIRGEYFGVRFRPYGKGPGRYDTGNMFSAMRLLDSKASMFQGSKKKIDSYVIWGYKKSMDRSPRWGSPYFLDQELGFLNPFSFRPDETRANGRATFGPSRSPRRVKGARALEAGMERIGDRADEYYSKAWENAKKVFESKGFASASVGTYIDAKNAYNANPPRRLTFGSNPAGMLTSAFGPDQGFIDLRTGEIYGNIFKI